MNLLKKFKLPFLTFLFSAFVILIAKAATPYTVSVIQWNESEFPRIQARLKIEGDTEGLLPKNLVIQENEKINIGPMAFLPPHDPPSQIDLNILLDTSSKTAPYQRLILNNLKGLIGYFNEKKIDLQIKVTSFDGKVNFQTNDMKEMVTQLNQITFSEIDASKIDGFAKLTQVSKMEGRPKAQKIMLILNGSAFEDTKNDGVTGIKMREAISSTRQNNDLIFVLGHPLQQIHRVRADAPTAELSDFAHNVPGGYLGGFGTDLTSWVDLLFMQSPENFVLQYYTNQPPSGITGSQAKLFIDGGLVQEFTYQAEPATELVLHHIPENELAVGDSIPLTVEIENKGKAINAVELNYKNKEGNFIPLPLMHERHSPKTDSLNYNLNLPETVFSDEYFTYYLSVHTPYTSSGSETGAVTLPVNIYDDGILLEAKLSGDKKAVLWSWTGPTVEKGKTFEIWAGDVLLTTADQRNYTIPLEECNRYQILQVQVIFPDGTKSHPSRPFEFFAEGSGSSVPFQEKQALELFLRCLTQKRIDTYSQFAATTPDFIPTQPLNLEKAALYFTKLTHTNLWEKLKIGSGYYELMLYIMKFLNKEQYLKYGIEGSPVENILIYKLITKANFTTNLENTFNRGFSELSTRVRGNISL